MGNCSCSGRSVMIDYISEITDDFFKTDNYGEIKAILTGNFTYLEKDEKDYEECRELVFNTSSSQTSKINKILENFVNKKREKVNVYDLLIFVFPITKHENEILDFYQLAMNFEKKPTDNMVKSLDRSKLKKTLKKMVSFHSEFILKFVTEPSIKEECDIYKKKFTFDNIDQYIDYLMSEFDTIMKRNSYNSKSLLGNQSYFFNLDDLNLCFRNYLSTFFNQRYLIMDFENYVDNHLS